MASEHGAFSPSAKDESKSKKSKKASNDSGSDISDDSVVGKSLKAKSRTVKKKDVLFRVRFWRVVLGMCNLVEREGGILTIHVPQTKPIISRTGTPRQRWPAAIWWRNIGGA